MLNIEENKELKCFVNFWSIHNEWGRSYGPWTIKYSYQLVWLHTDPKYLHQQNQKGFGTSRQCPRGVFIKRNFHELHLFFLNKRMAPSWLVWSSAGLASTSCCDTERKEPNSWRVEEESDVDTKPRDLSTTGASHALSRRLLPFYQKGELDKANSHLGRAQSLVK